MKYPLKEPSPIFSTFPNFLRYLCHKEAHSFLISHAKFHSWKVFRLGEINENVSGYLRLLLGGLFDLPSNDPKWMIQEEYQVPSYGNNN